MWHDHLFSQRNKATKKGRKEEVGTKMKEKGEQYKIVGARNSLSNMLMYSK